MNNEENPTNTFVVSQTLIQNGNKSVLGKIITPFTKPLMPIDTNLDGKKYIQNNFFG